MRGRMKEWMERAGEREKMRRGLKEKGREVMSLRAEPLEAV